MSARDDLRPGTPSLLFEEAGPERSTRSERDREADTARACEALVIPVALPVPPQSPRADKEAAAQLLRAVEEYLRQVLGTRVVQPPARHLRVTAESGSSLRDTA